jgi:hypothetical protein
LSDVDIDVYRSSPCGPQARYLEQKLLSALHPPLQLPTVFDVRVPPGQGYLGHAAIILLEPGGKKGGYFDIFLPDAKVGTQDEVRSYLLKKFPGTEIHSRGAE